LIKSAKLYFYDTGVACPLLGIKEQGQINFHYLKGLLFENLILNEFIKCRINQGENRRPYYFQDNHGFEIDCILENGNDITIVEIKSGKTISTSYFTNINHWRKITNTPVEQSYVIYGGDQTVQTQAGALVSWRDMGRMEEGCTLGAPSNSIKE
jgi:hypothetical protein